MLSASELELWRGDRLLFARLSFEVRAGEVLHVTGPNGIGKSSLLRVLAGLSRPETGTVHWGSDDVFKKTYGFYSALSYLGHRDGLKGELSALDNLAFAAALRPQGATSADIAEAVAAVGLTAVDWLPLRQLSAGQRRRVAICRSLLARGALWILDEPFSNLDTAGREWGHRRVAQHLTSGGLAIITSHHPLSIPGIAVRELALG
ncbi:MAG: cytochrome c biogenesis heme-transporting ATPase CcmA [Pseudomonadota bacterium]